MSSYASLLAEDSAATGVATATTAAVAPIVNPPTPDELPVSVLVARISNRHGGGLIVPKVKHEVKEHGNPLPTHSKAIASSKAVATKKQRNQAKLQRLTSAKTKGLLLNDCSSKLDPFAALPATLDKFQEGLLRWYLFQYPRAQYGFHPELRPHPVHTNFTISLTTPACFSVILARSALTQFNLKTYDSEQERLSLEQATLRHKVEAIQTIHRLSIEYNKTNKPETKDGLLASIMSLGNLDRRAGAAGSVDVHYTAIRRILKSTGGPLAVGNPALRRVSLFFECMYGTSPNSYVWDASDFPTLLEGFNGFLQEVYEMACANMSKESDSGGLKRWYIGPDSILCTRLSRMPLDIFNPTHQDQLELVWQMTAMLMIASLVVDNRDNVPKLRSLMIDIHRAVEKGPPKLTQRDATTNVMWLLFQGINDPSSWSSEEENEHSRRILRVAGWVFVCKYLNFTMRSKVRTWILQFLTGAPMTVVQHPSTDGAQQQQQQEQQTPQQQQDLQQQQPQPFKLSLFDFSYAS